MLSVRKRAVWILTAIVIVTGLCSQMSLVAQESALPRMPDEAWADGDPPPGFTALFNGHDLDGWWGAGTEDPRGYLDLPPDALAARKAASLADIHAHWHVDENGELVNDGAGLYLTTDKNYGDFQLLIDYKTVPTADSGIYLRGIPQVQIWDSTEAGGKWDSGADKGSGGLWNNSRGARGKDPLTLADKPFGEWNHLDIQMVGEYVTVYLNGYRVVDNARLEDYFDRSRPIPRAGPIQLQTHGGEIRWRNIFIREIAADEANTILRQHHDIDFVPIFNGVDFEGWQGPTENYDVVDGAITCKPGHGGTIFTQDEYADFIVRFEFKLPPGGNNGLAIRYPGHGDTAYTGMCELQVLDNSHPKFANLDPRQYHGSIYGQAPAQRGYLRPSGEWNFQQVSVIGSEITVELNGTRILDCETGALTEFMYDEGQFAGRMRTSGYFGFAGHSDPVQFREIVIKRINEHEPMNSVEDAAQQLAAYERRRMWSEYLQGFTPRGKGWLYASLATALLRDTNVQPVHPEAGSGSQRMLEEFGLQELKTTFRNQGGSMDEACRRLAHHIGDRGPEFIERIAAAGAELMFAPDAVFEFSSSDENGATLTFEHGSALRFIQRDGEWLCDGGPEV